jgi:hypothetical protein
MVEGRRFSFSAVMTFGAERKGVVITYNSSTIKQTERDVRRIGGSGLTAGRSTVHRAENSVRIVDVNIQLRYIKDVVPSNGLHEI